ncbi:MAG: DUF3500 domain-containing protein [Gemmataceae bacterium]|nr:DUF3500 domain-containing protein [Gemmataceae bacterium]MCI0737729.1 DUF3500 domain-containing protein [Gemmataceae bacterium]
MSEHPFQQSSHQSASRKRGPRLLPAVAVVLLLGLSVYASRATLWPALSSAAVATGDEKTTANAVAKANAFLEMLDAQQRGKALLEYTSAKKPAWSNLPVTMVPRNGLPLGELTKAQRAAALDVLAAVLSKQGFQKVIDIMNADDQLVKGKDNKMKFGTDNFYLALFGKPSATEPWMLQFGGHHLGINVTVVGKNAVLTPTHTGTQPDTFTRDGKTVRPLGPENDLAFKLVNMLDAEQQKKAILGAKPKNLVLGPGQDGKTIAPEGIKGAALNEAQRAALMELIGAWVHILPQDAAASRMAALKAKLDVTYFAWYGPTTNGSAVYYRVQGPTLVIEYAPQGGTNHIHTIIRDPSNDYGAQLTKS